MGVINGVFTTNNSAEQQEQLVTIARRLSGTFMELLSGFVFDPRHTAISENWIVSGAGDTGAFLSTIESQGIESGLNQFSENFAFVVVDRRNGTLHLIRDAFGTKPLFFGKIDGCWAFADSPAKIANAATGNTPWKLDKEGLYRFILLGATWGQHTLFSGIESVPPGSSVTIRSDGSQSTSHYYLPTPSRSEFSTELLQTIKQDANVPVFQNGSVAAAILEQGKEGNSVVSASEKVNRNEALRRLANETGLPFAGDMTAFEIGASCRKEGIKKIAWSIGADALFLGSPDTPTPQSSREFQSRRRKNHFPHACLATQLRQLFGSPENIKSFGRNLEFNRDLLWLRDQISPLQGDACAAYRWVELSTRVRELLVPMTFQIGGLYGVEIEYPFLKTEFVDCVLGMEEHQLVDSSFGSQAPLRRHLVGAGAHPLIWDSDRPDGFAAFIDHEITDERLTTLEVLTKLQIFIFDGKTGSAAADFKRFLCAAEGFAVWADEWIKTGKVTTS